MKLDKQDLINYINNDKLLNLNKPFTSRMLRFLISEGVVDKPEGMTSSSKYDKKHIDQIKSYYTLKSSGHTVKQIASMSNASHRKLISLKIIPGMTICLSDEFNCQNLNKKQATKKFKLILKELIEGEKK